MNTKLLLIALSFCVGTVSLVNAFDQKESRRKKFEKKQAKHLRLKSSRQHEKRPSSRATLRTVRERAADKTTQIDSLREQRAKAQQN